jgi:hypothetical protein
MAAAGPTMVTVGLFDLIGRRHRSPVLLQALIGGVLLAVALLTLLIEIAISLAGGCAGFLGVEVVVAACSFWTAVLWWDGG